MIALLKLFIGSLFPPLTLLPAITEKIYHVNNVHNLHSLHAHVDLKFQSNIESKSLHKDLRFQVDEHFNFSPKPAEGEKSLIEYM